MKPGRAEQGMGNTIKTRSRHGVAWQCKAGLASAMYGRAWAHHNTRSPGRGKAWSASAGPAKAKHGQHHQQRDRIMGKDGQGRPWFGSVGQSKAQAMQGMGNTTNCKIHQRG